MFSRKDIHHKYSTGIRWIPRSRSVRKRSPSVSMTFRSCLMTNKWVIYWPTIKDPFPSFNPFFFRQRASRARRYGYRRPLSTVSKQLFRFRSEPSCHVSHGSGVQRVAYIRTCKKLTAIKCSLRISQFPLRRTTKGSWRSRTFIFFYRAQTLLACSRIYIYFALPDSRRINHRLHALLIVRLNFRSRFFLSSSIALKFLHNACLRSSNLSVDNLLSMEKCLCKLETSKIRLGVGRASILMKYISIFFFLLFLIFTTFENDKRREERIVPVAKVDHERIQLHNDAALVNRL